MEEEVILKFKNNCMGINEPITYLDLFYFIRKGYMRIYKEEEEKHTEIMPFIYK
jgi:CRP-like cAMP-binding protein